MRPKLPCLEDRLLLLTVFALGLRSIVKIFYGFDDSGSFMQNENENSQISIHIFAWRRHKSLQRLLRSLNRARYHGHRVPLVLHIDGEPLPSVIELAHSFRWPHGRKVVEISEERKGLPSAIAEAWDPRTENEYAIFLEDDNAVSRAFFEWALLCIDFGANNCEAGLAGSAGLMGCSLYTPMVNEIGPAKKAWHPPKWRAADIIGSSSPYFYFQLPCSWGAVYFSGHWIKFREYFNARKNIVSPPLIPNSRTNEWNKSWKRMLIELMLLNGWYLLYPNFKRSASFSTNYFEMGIHSQPEDVKELKYPDNLRKKDWRFTVPLIHSIPEEVYSFVNNSTSVIPYVDLYHAKVAGRDSLYGSDELKKEISTIIAS